MKVIDYWTHLKWVHICKHNKFLRFYVEDFISTEIFFARCISDIIGNIKYEK